MSRYCLPGYSPTNSICNAINHPYHEPVIMWCVVTGTRLVLCHSVGAQQWAWKHIHMTPCVPILLLCSSLCSMSAEGGGWLPSVVFFRVQNQEVEVSCTYPVLCLQVGLDNEQVQAHNSIPIGLVDVLIIVLNEGGRKQIMLMSLLIIYTPIPCYFHPSLHHWSTTPHHTNVTSCVTCTSLHDWLHSPLTILYTTCTIRLAPCIGWTDDLQIVLLHLHF